jgi:hypothetical protein
LLGGLINGAHGKIIDLKPGQVWWVDPGSGRLRLELDRVDEKIKKVMTRCNPADPVTRQNPVKNPVATR